MTEEPRCTHCGETRQVEKISRPLWTNTKAELWFCSVCAKTFVVGKAEVY